MGYVSLSRQLQAKIKASGRCYDIFRAKIYSKGTSELLRTIAILARHQKKWRISILRVAMKCLAMEVFSWHSCVLLI